MADSQCQLAQRFGRGLALVRRARRQRCHRLQQLAEDIQLLSLASSGVLQYPAKGATV